MMNWLRTNVYASGILLIIRLYLGYEWITAGWHKLTGATPFSAAGFLKGMKPVLESATKEPIYPTYNAFIQHFAIPNVDLFNFLVPYGEFLIGLGLILGVLTTAATFFALLMNMMFMLGGSVSTNPWLFMLGAIVLVAGFNAGRFGGDYWVIPWIRQYTGKLFKKNAGAAA